MDQFYGSYYNQNAMPGQGFMQKPKKPDAFGLFFLKRCWLVLLAALVFAGFGFAVTQFIVPAGYMSSCTILVSSESNRSGYLIVTPSGPVDPTSGNVDDNKLAKTFSNILICSDEINALLKKGSKMEVSVIEDTDLIQIKVIADSSNSAYTTASMVQDRSVALFHQYYDYGRVLSVDSPKSPANSYRPFVMPAVLISAGAGALLAFFAVLIWYALKKSK